MLLIAVESGTEEEVRETGESLYEEAVGKYRPLISLASFLLPKALVDLKPVITGAFKAAIAYQEDPEIQNLADEFSQHRAALRFKRLEENMAAGFTREEAMALLLLDSANVKTAADMAKVNSSSSSSSRY